MMSEMDLEVPFLGEKWFVSGLLWLWFPIGSKSDVEGLMAGYLVVIGDEHLEVSSDEEFAGHGDGCWG